MHRINALVGPGPKVVVEDSVHVRKTFVRRIGLGSFGRGYNKMFNFSVCGEKFWGYYEFDEVSWDRKRITGL